MPVSKEKAREIWLKGIEVLEEQNDLEKQKEKDLLAIQAIREFDIGLTLLTGKSKMWGIGCRFDSPHYDRLVQSKLLCQFFINPSDAVLAAAHVLCPERY